MIKNMKMKKIGSKTMVSVLVLAIVFFATIAPIQAQYVHPTYTVTGFVYDIDGVTLVDGVDVTVTDSDTVDSLSYTTQAGGYYAVVFGSPATDNPVTEGDTLEIFATYDGGNRTNTTIITAGGAGDSPRYVELILQDVAPPTVIGVLPADGATGVSLTPMIAAQFDEPMNTTSTEAAFSVDGLAGLFSWNPGNTIMTFTPTASLADSTTYTVTIAATATDLAGNGLDGDADGTAEGSPTDDYTWPFTTVDLTAPTVTSVSPLDGATNVLVTSTISATFSEEVDIASVEAAFSVDGVTGTFRWTAENTTMTFTPDTILAYNTTYNVTIAATAADLAGNPLAAYNWSFITGAPDTTVPYTSGHNPAKSATGVSISTNIVVHVMDDGVGVDNATIVMTVEGAVVAPLISGTPADFTLTYNPPTNFDYSQVVDVTIDADDLNATPNVMTQDAYSFTTASRPPSGGGGGPPLPSDTTSVSTEATGEVTASVTASSADAKAAATIPAGTIAKDAAGKALTTVTVTPPSKLPAAPPAGTAYVGYTYNFGPTGATFNPAIEIAIEFDPAKFDKTPVIYVYEAGAWKALETTVEGNKATATVDHFSTFVLFDAEKVVPPPETPTPTVEPTTTAVPTAEPTVEPTPTPEPTAKLPWGLIIGIIVAVIIVSAAAYYFYTKKS